MKASHTFYLARGIGCLPKNVFGRRFINGTRRTPMSTSTRRYQEDGPEGKSTGHWTPHTFKSSAVDIPQDDSRSSGNPSERHTAYIAVGSNMGNRIGWIEKALNMMPKKAPIKVRRTSSLWETEPMYVTDQENFVNGVIEIETDMKPWILLEKLQSIEKALGRQKTIDKGPRNIDLDILLYDDISYKSVHLTIPHQLMLEREFVLRPLAELIPGKAINPGEPWRLTQDYLNALPPSNFPMSTLTPLNNFSEPLRALQSHRRTQVMGILNLTPDSFSDGGAHKVLTDVESKERFSESVGTAYAHISRGGASIIDIGGQSSAPHTQDVSAREEADRVVPTIKWIRQRHPKSIISVDTYRASVADEAVRAGADIINDISAGQLDPEMLRTMAKSGKTVCLMHMRGTPHTMNKLTDYSPAGLIPTIASELLARVAEAEKAGIRRWRIILDPGIGFAKNSEQNLEILRRFDELRNWPGLAGFPWLVGSSRKGFIGKITGVDTPKQRTWGTAATVAAAVQGGADIVRVHDVKEMAQVAKMSDAIWRV